MYNEYILFFKFMWFVLSMVKKKPLNCTAVTNKFSITRINYIFKPFLNQIFNTYYFM